MKFVLVGTIQNAAALMRDESLPVDQRSNPRYADMVVRNAQSLEDLISRELGEGVSGPAVPRVLLLVALFLAIVGPWIAMAMAGIFATSSEAAVMAAPSPAYAFFMLNALTQGSHDQRVILAAGLTSALAWGLLGIGLLLIALGRTKRRVREERTLREALESPPSVGAEAAQG